MKTWSSYEKAAEKGPIQIGIKITLVMFLFFAVVWGLGTVFEWFGAAANVAKEEFGPSAALQKYEWFKDSSAELDKKKADIAVYKTRITTLQQDYEGVARKDWPRSDREQMSVWRGEHAGVVASFNGLAAEYNAQMAKFNWSFANAGQLPQGATETLPREFKTYTQE